jgi:hypothetical protein
MANPTPVEKPQTLADITVGELNNMLRVEDSEVFDEVDREGNPCKRIFFSIYYKTRADMQEHGIFTCPYPWEVDGKLVRITICDETMRRLQLHTGQLGITFDGKNMKRISSFKLLAANAEAAIQTMKPAKRCAECRAESARVPCQGCMKIFFCNDACSKSHMSKHTLEICANFKRNGLL